MLLVKPLNVCLIFRWMCNYSVTCLAFQTHSFQRLEKKRGYIQAGMKNTKDFFFFCVVLKRFLNKFVFEVVCSQSWDDNCQQLAGKKAKVSLKSNKTHMTWNCTILSLFVTTARFLCHSGKKIVKCLGVFFVTIFLKGIFFWEAAAEGIFVGYFSFKA